MRVVSGTARGRRLKTPAGDGVRPTADNVKEAMFNIIMNDIAGRRILDLFAGSGQLGIEALSRGAESAVFVDNNAESVKLVRENLAVCGFEATVAREDALNYLGHCGKFDVIFIDPPYDMNLYEPVLDKVILFDILSEGGIIICESRRERELPELVSPYSKVREYNYGSVKLVKYTKEHVL